MFTMEVELECECKECNTPLTFDVTLYRNRNIVKVEPCDKCLTAAREEGVKEGRDDAGRDDY